MAVIFDFDDDWHCALNLRKEMKKSEVAEALLLLADIIMERTDKEKEYAKSRTQ